MGKPTARTRLHKRPDARRNAKPRAVVVRHAGQARSTILTARLDKRTVAYRAYTNEIEALTAHVGGNPSAVQARLIEQAGRLALLEHIAWCEMTATAGLTADGALKPVFDAFMRAARDRRAVLQLLGVEPRSKPVPDLQSYLADEYGEEDTNTD